VVIMLSAQTPGLAQGARVWRDSSGSVLMVTMAVTPYQVSATPLRIASRTPPVERELVSARKDIRKKDHCVLILTSVPVIQMSAK